MGDKEQFKKAWDTLIHNFSQVIKIAENNRRLLAGITRLLIEKEIITAADVAAIEGDVTRSTDKPATKKRKRRSKKKRQEPQT